MAVPGATPPICDLAAFDPVGCNYVASTQRFYCANALTPVIPVIVSKLRISSATSAIAGHKILSEI